MTRDFYHTSNVIICPLKCVIAGFHCIILFSFVFFFILLFLLIFFLHFFHFFLFLSSPFRVPLPLDLGCNRSSSLRRVLILFPRSFFSLDLSHEIFKFPISTISNTSFQHPTCCHYFSLKGISSSIMPATKDTFLLKTKK